jgi:HD-GYP domain-containing protein (c-di-GMP phosphodiesterase class II)
MRLGRKRPSRGWFGRLRPTVQRRLKIAVPYSLMGLAALVGSFFYSEMPDWRYWFPFAILFVLLEFFAVEVNDRALQSSSVMVAMTAGVILAVLPGSDAMFGLALMAALGPFTALDFKEKRWFQPLANFGQMVTAGAVSGFILDAFLEGVDASTTDSLIMVLIVSAAAALAYTTVQTVLVRHAVKVAFGRDNLEPWSQMPVLFTGEVAMGLVGGLIGAAFLIADSEAIIVFIVGVFAISHMWLYAYSQLRDAHIGSIRGFVKTLEAKDMYTRGHTERVAFFAQMIGEEMGFSGTQLETVRWSALIHDLGKLAVPTELIRKRGRLDEDEYAEMKAHAQLVEEILAEVDFLQPMVEIASGHHSNFDGSGYGGSGHSQGEEPRIEACIVAAADAFDAMTSARSYRMALSQQYAIAELRRNAGAQFHPEVVDAFERALNKTGRRWGAPHVNDEEMARRLAEEPELTLRG